MFPLRGRDGNLCHSSRNALLGVFATLAVRHAHRATLSDPCQYCSGHICCLKPWLDSQSGPPACARFFSQMAFGPALSSLVTRFADSISSRGSPSLSHCDGLSPNSGSSRYRLHFNRVVRRCLGGSLLRSAARTVFCAGRALHG